VWGKGEDREVVGAAQTEEGLLHVCFDGVWEGSVRVGETNVEQLVVEMTPGARGACSVPLRWKQLEERQEVLQRLQSRGGWMSIVPTIVR